MKIFNPSIQSTEISGSINLTDSATGSILAELTSSLDSLYANLYTFNSYTSSNDSTNATQTDQLNQLSTETGSLQNRVGLLETFTELVNNKNNTLQTYTSSINNKFDSLAIYTASNDTTNTTQNNRLDLLSTFSGSANSRLINIENFTSSIDTTIKTKLNVEGVISGSSQVSYTGLSNIPSGIVSSSTQVNFNQLSNISANIISASTDSSTVDFNINNGTISANLIGGVVSGSSQVNFNQLSNISSGIVSSSTQITPLLPAGTISGSSQVQLENVTGTTFSSNAYTFPGDLIVSGTLFLQEGQEKIVTASIATSGSTNYDILSQSVLYRTANATNNWTLNLRGSPTVTFNNAVSVGKSITVVFMVTNGATPYKQVGLQIDGVSVTPRWQGGAQLSGSANSVDSYTIVVFKTGTGGSSAYSVFESITQFK